MSDVDCRHITLGQDSVTTFTDEPHGFRGNTVRGNGFLLTSGIGFRGTFGAGRALVLFHGHTIISACVIGYGLNDILEMTGIKERGRSGHHFSYRLLCAAALIGLIIGGLPSCCLPHPPLSYSPLSPPLSRKHTCG
jgi:hypothetical protein